MSKIDNPVDLVCRGGSVTSKPLKPYNQSGSHTIGPLTADGHRHTFAIDAAENQRLANEALHNGFCRKTGEG